MLTLRFNPVGTMTAREMATATDTLADVVRAVQNYRKGLEADAPELDLQADLIGRVLTLTQNCKTD